MSDDSQANEVEQSERAKEEKPDFGAIQRLAMEKDANIFLVSGPIYYPLADSLIETLDRVEKTRSNAIVFLCTGGGDPDAAFIIARTLKKRYKKFSLYISGLCKSAGTLIALGADEIVMGSKGELGPLDTQMPKEDSFTSTSGLDSTDAIFSLQLEALHMFDNVFSDLARKYGNRFTTRTAAKIATNLVVGVLSPIAAQIDPLKLAENQRALRIATKYGEQLGADEKCVHRLIYGYPSHGHVIDFEEAKDIFGDNRVKSFEPLDVAVEDAIQSVMKILVGQKCIRWPYRVKDDVTRGIVLPFHLVERTDSLESEDGEDDRAGEDEGPQDESDEENSGESAP